MNVQPGGTQPKLRTTTWAGKEQKMVYDNSTAKGTRTVLEERGINTTNTKVDNMGTVLSFNKDFPNRKNNTTKIYCGRRANGSLFTKVPL